MQKLVAFKHKSGGKLYFHLMFNLHNLVGKKLTNYMNQPQDVTPSILRHVVSPGCLIPAGGIKLILTKK